MDNNKKLKLLDIGYSIRPCCGLCVNGVFPHNDWGTCRVFNYEHLKHTGTERNLSINKFGSCNNFIRDEEKVTELGAFDLFLPPKRD